MRGWVVGLGALGLVGATSACNPAPRAVPGEAVAVAVAVVAGDCPAARRTGPGLCCPAWTVADTSGACRARPWALPGKGDALGDPAARNVSVAVDARARALVGFASSGGVELLEESAPGAWTLRRPGLAVGGVMPGDLVAGPDGSAAFAWTTLTGSNQTVFVSERDAAGAWHDPASVAEALSFPTTGCTPRLATNAGGEWLLAWDQWMTTDNFGVAVARKRSARDTWTRPASRDDVLSVPINFTNTPVIALDDAGRAIITWHQAAAGPLGAFASERAGTDAPFTRPVPGEALSAPGGAVDSDPVAAVKPAIARDGAAAVVWTQENGKGATLVYLATRDAAGRWTRPRDLADAFSLPTGYARGVQLAFGPRGELYVVWYQDAGGGNAVYAARRRADGTWAEGGRTPIRLSSPDVAGLFPRLAVGPEGGVVVVWTERAGLGRMRVMARRADGLAPWGPRERLSQETGDDAELADVAVGPHDRAVAAWAQGPGPAQRVFVARVE